MRYLRIISSRTGPEGSYGILKGETVHLLSGSPLSAGAKETGVKLALKEVKKFLPPVEAPNVIALGLNYREHATEIKMELPSAPVIFLKATSSLAGHLEPVILPAEAPAEVDYEAELVVVIGKAAKNIPEKKASEYIFGYTCGNDVTARDCQWKTDKQWARAKSFDTFSPIGPWITDEVDPDNLKIEAYLNGKCVQSSWTSNMIFPVKKIFSFISQIMTLHPGDVIATGTPVGVGPMKPGDRVEIKIEKIGVLRNYIIRESKN